MTYQSQGNSYTIISSSPSYSMMSSYSGNVKPQAPGCCGRKAAGPHMQCGSCPTR